MWLEEEKRRRGIPGTTRLRGAEAEALSAPAGGLIGDLAALEAVAMYRTLSKYSSALLL